MASESFPDDVHIITMKKYTVFKRRLAQLSDRFLSRQPVSPFSSLLPPGTTTCLYSMQCSTTRQKAVFHSIHAAQCSCYIYVHKCCKSKPVTHSVRAIQCSCCTCVHRGSKTKSVLHSVHVTQCSCCTRQGSGLPCVPGTHLGSLGV